MSFGLGFWAAASGSAAPAGAYEQISTTILTSTTASVTFSSIPQDYKHLQIRAAIRGASSGTENYARIRINGSSSTYRVHQLYGLGSNIIGSNTLAEDSIQLPVIPGPSDTANTFGAVITDILDYASSSINKTTRSLGGCMTPNNAWIALNSGLYLSTSAITSLTYYAVNGSNVSSSSIATGSRISLYGVRG